MLTDEERILTPEKRERMRNAFYGLLLKVLNAPDKQGEPVTPYDDGEGATPQRLAMAGDDVEEFTPDKNEHWRAIRMLDGHVLELLQSRGTITGDQYAAGVQFYSDWYFGGLANSGVIDPGRVVVDGGKIDHMNDVKMAALTKWQHAVRAVGLIHSTVLTDIILNETRLEDYGRTSHLHKADKLSKVAATASLRDALTELDLHYHGQRRNPQRASHADDYRPGIPPRDTPP